MGRAVVWGVRTSLEAVAKGGFGMWKVEERCLGARTNGYRYGQVY